MILIHLQSQGRQRINKQLNIEKCTALNSYGSHVPHTVERTTPTHPFFPELTVTDTFGIPFVCAQFELKIVPTTNLCERCATNVVAAAGKRSRVYRGNCVRSLFVHIVDTCGVCAFLCVCANGEGRGKLACLFLLVRIRARV